MDTAQLAGIVIAVCAGGGLTAAINWLAGRKKLGADAVKVYTDTTLALLKPMREEIERLETRVRVVNDQLSIAAALLRQHNVEWPPGATPPPWA